MRSQTRLTCLKVNSGVSLLDGDNPPKNDNDDMEDCASCELPSCCPSTGELLPDELGLPEELA